MKTSSVMRPFSLLPISLAIAACSQAPIISEKDISVEPESLDEAGVSLDQIEQLQAVDPAAAHRLLEQLQPRLDQLNHLVARVEAAPGTFVSFYESQPGVIGIAERGPADGERVLQADDLGMPISILYRKLAGSEPPAVLVAAERREQGDGARARFTSSEAGAVCDSSIASSRSNEGDVSTTQQGLTAADGPWWAANVCYKSGDFRGCFPNWSGGGFATASAKTSFFQVAPFSGDFVSVRFQYEGSTRFTDPVFKAGRGHWWWHSDSFADCWCSPICACGTFDYNRRSHRWDILNASGEGFHWTHAFKWTCEDTLSCGAEPAQ